MGYFVIGLLFGFIFASLWWQRSSWRYRAPVTTASYERARPTPVVEPEVGQLRSALDSSAARERSLKSTLNAQAIELKNLKSQLDGLSANREAKQADYHTLKSQQDTLRRTLAERDKAIMDLETRLKTELTAKTQALAKLEADYHTQAELVAALRTQSAEGQQG